MTKRYADLRTHDAATNPNFWFLDTPTRKASGLLFLGQATWDMDGAGKPVFPAFKLDDAADPLSRKDVLEANGILVNAAPAVHEAFFAVRQIIVDCADRVHTLTGLAYSPRAIADATKNDIARWFDQLDGINRDVLKARDRCDTAYSDASQRFPDFGESEIQSSINDAALVARNGMLTEGDKAALNDGNLPKKFSDVRMVRALTRVPAGMHSVADKHLELIVKRHTEAIAPCTVQVIGILRPMVASVRQVLAAAVIELARVALIPPDQAFKIINGGDWLAEIRFMVGASRQDQARWAVVEGAGPKMIEAIGQT